MEATRFELPFVKKEQLTLDTYTFYFDRSAHQFDFLAGQYFRDTLQIENPDDRGSSRYFTVSSSPTDELLTITTRIIQSSFKFKLNGLRAGDKMTFFGPFGEMFQDEKDLTPKVFLAGGIGLTPAHSMLRFIDFKKINVGFTLLVSFPVRSEVVFYDELKAIEQENAGVKVVYSLTKEKKPVAGFEKGRIDINMVRKYGNNFDSAKFYTSGPPVMAEAMEAIIKEAGVAEERIVNESFTGY